MKQVHWQSKWTFILAAIGSAAGLGNLWRFPYQVYDHGGWSFIIAYLVILIVLGLGLLVGEIAIGQKYQSGAVVAYEKLQKGFGWLGWVASFGVFGILAYYMVVVGWGMHYFGHSVANIAGGTLPWASDAGSYFYGDVLALTEGPHAKGILSQPVVIGLIASYILLYLFTFKSIRSVGKVVWFTATIPFVTLFALAIYALTLPGSGLGMSYLTTVNLGQLFESETWIAAAAQIFFTLSVGMGVMITFGSFKSDKSEIVKSTITVALGNTLISFLAAITVFASLGYLATSQGVGIDEVVSGGPGLIFVVFPGLFASLGSIGPLISTLFFATVFFLAIDSAMSLYECFARVIHNIYTKIQTEVLTLILILITLCISLIFAYGNGLYLLDILDYYITSYLMLIIGLMTVILLTKYNKDISKYLSKRSDWKWIPSTFWQFTWVAGIVILAFLLYQNIASGLLSYDEYPSEILEKYGLTPLLCIFIASFLIHSLSSKKIK